MQAGQAQQPDDRFRHRRQQTQQPMFLGIGSPTPRPGQAVSGLLSTLGFTLNTAKHDIHIVIRHRPGSSQETWQQLMRYHGLTSAHTFKAAYRSLQT